MKKHIYIVSYNRQSKKIKKEAFERIFPKNLAPIKKKLSKDMLIVKVDNTPILGYKGNKNVAMFLFDYFKSQFISADEIYKDYTRIMKEEEVTKFTKDLLYAIDKTKIKCEFVSFFFT